MSPEAPPRARDARRADKPLSPLASLGVAALTGAAVFAAGVHAVERRWPDLAAPPSASEALPAASEALPAASEALPAASEAPPAASAAPPAPSASAAAGSPPRPGRGSLEVRAAEEATVYVNGTAVGSTRGALEVPCGLLFVRLGARTPQGTRWIGAGKTVVVACEARTEVNF